MKEDRPRTDEVASYIGRMNSPGWYDARHVIRCAALLACLTAGPIGCGPDDRDDAADPSVLVIAVPVPPLAGLVDAIAPHGAVRTVIMVPPGANPATHEPALPELRDASSARLYVAIGHPSFVFERTWLRGLLEDSEAETIAAFEDCPVVPEDYHVWLSTDCLATAANRIAEEIVALLPEARPVVAGNLEAFRRRVASTDSAGAARLGPLRGRSFFVLHPAWGYLARRYGLTQVSILSHGTGDPGPARLAALIERGRREGSGVVLVQPQFNEAPARIVADALGARIVSVDPLARDPLAAIDEVTAVLAGSMPDGEPAQ